MYKAEVRGPLILGNKDYRQITSDIIAPIDNPTPGWWKVALAISLTMASFGIFALYYTVRYGLGTWAVNNSVAWGWEIINFVWWIGIGHAGTAFSIFLLILRQKWRTSINRAAEAMTVFAVVVPLFSRLFIWAAFGWHSTFSLIPIPADLYGLTLTHRFSGTLSPSALTYLFQLRSGISEWFLILLPSATGPKQKQKRLFTVSSLSAGPVRPKNGCATKV